MKNQYFGDVRDLFKYDLLQYILQNSSSYNNVLFVTMLTPDDETTEGNKISYNRSKAGFLNLHLIHFLNKRLKVERKVENILEYFDSQKLEMELYNPLFNHQKRHVYFDELSKKIKNHSLIFFDPDNGLEVKINNEKHLLFDELQSVLERMEEDSTIMIYQHFPRVKRLDYIKKRQFEIENRLGVKSNFISDNEIVFFFLSKNSKGHESIAKILTNYNTIYPKVYCENTIKKENPEQLSLAY